MRGRKIVRRVVVLGAILAVALIAAAACGGDDSSSGSPQEAREIRVRASDDLKFEPSEIRLKVGEPVRLVMENMGAAVHDVTVDEMPMMGGGSSGVAHDMGHGTDMGSGYAMHLAVESHRDGMMEFTPTERGNYTYYCSVEGHREAGMRGEMIVE